MKRRVGGPGAVSKPAFKSLSARTQATRRTTEDASAAQRARVRRWAWAGAVIGSALVVLRFLPAGWVADGIAQASGQRVQLADAQGTLWDGSAIVVVTGGSGSRDALALPSRLSWTLRPAVNGGAGFRLALSQDCCLPQPMQWRLLPGWGRLEVRLDSPGVGLAQWPADWLIGLGSPWNTLQPRGLVRWSADALSLVWQGGNMAPRGRSRVELLNLASRMSTLDRLGSYRIDIDSVAPNTPTRFTLSTSDGALVLSGSGATTETGVRFRGQGSAAEGYEATLNNLLNIIGRRNGPVTVISIG